MRALAGLALLLFTATCGGDDPNCGNACERLKGCGLSSSGISCDAECKTPDGDCAVCLNDTSCGDITAGKCTAACGGRTFIKK